MRTVIEHHYGYFKIYKMWGHAGSLWRWDMDYDHLADAAFYKGNLRTAEAFDKALIGVSLTNFCEFRRSMPHMSRLREFQRCVNDVDTEWYCLHGEGCELETSYLPLTGTAVVPVGTSFVVLEGAACLNLVDREATLTDMHHMKPREYPVPVTGYAKAFLIKQGVATCTTRADATPSPAPPLG
jgi:hypothetical protein